MSFYPLSMMMSFCACLYHDRDPYLCFYALSHCWNFCAYHCCDACHATTMMSSPYRGLCPCFCALSHCCWNAFPYPSSCHLSFYAYRLMMSSCGPYYSTIYAHDPCPYPCFYARTCVMKNAYHHYCSSAFRRLHVLYHYKMKLKLV